mgnify:CR=1 FL=1
MGILYSLFTLQMCENIANGSEFMTYVDCKSPLNYMGGKYNLVPQIVPLMPNDINTFIDLFGGGFNVGVAVFAKHIIYNDICKQLCQLLQWFIDTSTQDVHEAVMSVIKEYELLQVAPEKKTKFLQLRSDYNNDVANLGIVNVAKLYALIACGFNNILRFNRKGEFNIPYGERTYNSVLQMRLQCFVDRIHEIKDLTVTNKEYTDYRLYDFQSGDYLYCDPPYLNTLANYNVAWSEKQETELRNMLNSLTQQGVRWGLSNDISRNTTLYAWAVDNKYKIHTLSADYSNCHYKRKSDKYKATEEVLITNY